MAISMLKIRRPLGRLIFNMGIAIPGKTVFLIETAPRTLKMWHRKVPIFFYSDVTLTSLHPKSPASGLFVHQLVQVYIKQNIKDSHSHNWAFVRSSVDSLQKGTVMWKMSFHDIIMGKCFNYQHNVNVEKQYKLQIYFIFTHVSITKFSM